ncbi:MAG: acyl-ACP--UDP-N-acetylglucosamine O-acyltransferase [Proteobacteria bacterium]|nr:acyl-ACP--UDP-N-acetylglucosamine O-acyltransferase [Pseudomonadota bacterium]
MAKIHPSALVDPQAELAPSVEVGPYCVIGPHVKVDEGTKFMSHVVVDGWTTIGKHNTFFPFGSIGAVPQDLKYKGEKTELFIGDHNSIRENVTLNLGTVQGGGKTAMGSHNLIMAYVHFGHDVIVGNHVIIANSANLAGHVTVEDYANVGGMTGVIQFICVGAHSYVGGCSIIDRDVTPFTIVVGARPVELKGANIIGLRRRGYKNDTISAISESLKLWKRPDVMKEQCLLEIESQYGECPEVKQLVEFIRKSESGCVR